jgi:pyruvate,water dikinase
MSWLSDIIRQLFTKHESEPKNVEHLRYEFRVRYHSFKLLLSANQNALEIIADIERALEGDRPFGMTFIRSSCTSMAVTVYSMIRQLARLAPGKHEGLEERFDDIVEQTSRILTQERPITDKRLTIPLGAVDRDLADAVGSKMANLGEIIKKTDIRVPLGFVITAYAYRKFLDHNDLQSEINRRIQSADLTDMETLYKSSSEIQQLIIHSQVPADLSAALSDAWKRLEDEQGRPITVALRSSAIGEDQTSSTFAGQYRSELNVSRENILQAYKEILASKYSLQAIAYRLNKGFRDEDIAMCVGCMVMVDATAGGVIYSCNPVDSGDRSIFINAALGLPKSVVDGSTACDLFVVSRDDPSQIVREDIQVKTQKFVCYPKEGVCRMDLTGMAGSLPAIERQHVTWLAHKALTIESFYAAPQDIEWAMEADGSIFILQCRPLVLTDTPSRETDAANQSKNGKNVLLRGGITASAGAASGPVYLVDKEFDVLGFPEGAVLVARQALPRWASLLNRAAAVVTEQGGFAGHLANVAREFKVPALFGVEEAVVTLSPGEMVTVDATGLAVYRGKVASLLVSKDTRKTLIVGSPVHRILVEISRHIIPLNLLDPDSSDFKPQQCRTFHDITRYIHEKSVQEMFNFGRTHDFAERSAKQLHYHVPMQWWILNLDDGFAEEVPGKYVRLSNIVSLPMLAFWEGFAAIPWDGPPLDGKGLMSVMFHSTVNTALIPGVRSKFADRNYFMISKNYCNLSSRLGYHFAILEALVSDRKHENYASFQFKGGATDDQRRFKRVGFIRSILVEYDFRVQIKEDTLIARVEGRDKGYMLDRIKILGYLSLHTRQLDMIMSNPSKVNYHRNKINKDIQKIIMNELVGSEDGL